MSARACRRCEAEADLANARADLDLHADERADLIADLLFDLTRLRHVCAKKETTA